MISGLFAPGMESRASLAAPIGPSPPPGPPWGEGFDRTSFGGLRFVPRNPEHFNGLFAPGMESRACLAAPIDPSPPWGEGVLEGRMRGTARLATACSRRPQKVILERNKSQRSAHTATLTPSERFENWKPDLTLSTGDSWELRLSTSVFVCSEASSLCMIRSFIWEVPVTFGPRGTSEPIRLSSEMKRGPPTTLLG